jgi:hypothetical protein
VGQAVPVVHVVTRAGGVKQVRYTGDGGAVERVEYTGPDGRLHTDLVLSKEYTAQGWRLLRELYAEDPREQVREEGFAAYLAHDRAVKRRDQGTRHKPATVKGEEHLAVNREVPIAFPDEWLPAEVMARRGGTSTISARKYTPPTLAKASKKKPAGATA